MASLSFDPAPNPARDDNSLPARIRAWEDHNKGFEATPPDDDPNRAEAAAFDRAETPAETEWLRRQP